MYITLIIVIVIIVIVNIIRGIVNTPSHTRISCKNKKNLVKCKLVYKKLYIFVQQRLGEFLVYFILLFFSL